MSNSASRLLAPVLVSGAMVFGLPGAGSANTIVPDGPTEVGCELENFTVSVACIAGFPVVNNGGNVAGGDLDGLFSVGGVVLTGWSQIDKIDTVEVAGTQNGNNGLFYITTDAANTEGEWGLLADFVFDPTKYYIFALKGATMQVAYLMDSEVLAGLWQNDDLGYLHQPGNGNGNGNGNGKGKGSANAAPVWNVPGLSNIRLFEVAGRPYTPDEPGDDPVAPVPLPAAGWLMIAGLGALAAVRRRRKAA